MKRKKLTPRQELEKEVKDLKERVERWNTLLISGGSDPIWSDGCNMNLVRNHIDHHKRNIKEICEENDFPIPEEYFIKTPEKVAPDYIARKEEIFKNAKKTLKIYKKNRNYKWLIENRDRLTEKQKKKTSVNNVCGYVKWLENAIEEKDYIFMRRHENPENYMNSFESCKEKIEKILFNEGEEKTPQGQVSIFDFMTV